MTARPSTAQVWANLVTVYVVWGSTYLAIRVVVQAGLPPLIGMGARFVLAALLLGTILVWRRPGGLRRLQVSRHELAAAAAVGTLLAAWGNGVVAVAEQTVPSGLAALLIASVPLLLVVLRLLRRDRPPPLVWLGVVIGFAGVALLALRGGGIADVQPWGVGLMVVAAACWSVGSFFSPIWGVPRDALVATTYEMAIGGTVAVVAGFALGEGPDLDPAAVPARGWVALGYLVVVGSMLAYSAYAWLLQNAPISLTGTYAYVNPAVAVALGALVLHEPVTGVVLAGGGLAILGVALVVTAESVRRAPAPPRVRPVSRGRATTP